MSEEVKQVYITLLPSDGEEKWREISNRRECARRGESNVKIKSHSSIVRRST